MTKATLTGCNDERKAKTTRGKRGGKKGTHRQARGGKVTKKSKKMGGNPTPPVPDEIRSEAALKYLHKWSTDRESWTFKKKLQLWLIKNIYNKEKVGKLDFKILLHYLEGLQGTLRQRLVQEATDIVKNHSEQQQDSKQYKRAQRVLKHLT